VKIKRKDRVLPPPIQVFVEQRLGMQCCFGVNGLLRLAFGGPAMTDKFVKHLAPPVGLIGYLTTDYYD
jgi:hypothetical protein